MTSTKARALAESYIAARGWPSRDRAPDWLAAILSNACAATAHAEREACAKIAEDETNEPAPDSDGDGNLCNASPDEYGRAIAAAIRARSKPPCRCGHDPCECE